MHKTERIKLAVLALHPSNYQAGIWSELAKLEPLDATVYYLSDIGVAEIYDVEFGVRRKWDYVPLLEGYNYKFLRNYPVGSVEYGFLKRINPAVVREFFTKKYEVVLLHGYETATIWLAMLIAIVVKTKIIWRGEAVLRTETSSVSMWKKTAKKLALNSFFKCCDAVMFSCAGNKDYLKYYGVPESKLFPIPCAVDNDYFRNERDKYVSKRNEIRDELGIDSGDLVVLFSARFTSRKRPLDLLKAVKKLGNKDVTVLFVGDGVEKNSMESYALTHNIKAVFVGFRNQSEIAKFYSIADIAAVISDYDPSPKAMNEAMNFELPIIVTDIVGTARDLVKHGENGFVVKVGDIDAIATHIEYFYEERSEVRRMGKKSLEIVNGWNFEEDAQWIQKAVESVVNHQ